MKLSDEYYVGRVKERAALMLTHWDQLRKGAGDLPGFVYVDLTEGLCKNLSLGSLPMDVHELLHEAWPHYSADLAFPVPPVNFDEAGEEYHATHNLYIGEYGDLRKDLCQFIHDNVEAYYDKYARENSTT